MQLAEPIFNEEFEKMMSQGLRRGQVVRGEVIAVSQESVAVNIGYKYDGVVSIEEFAGKIPEVGEKIPVIVRKIDDRSGIVILSHRSAERKEALQKLNEHIRERKPVKGVVLKRVKGGYLVDLGFRFIRGIILDELSGLRAGERLNPGDSVEAYVDLIDVKRRRAILDRETFIKEKGKREVLEFLNTLEVGDKLKGKVKTITDFGVFVAVGPVDVLVRKRELDWKKFEHPADAVSEGQEVELVITSIDREKAKVQGSMRLARKTRWHSLAEKVKPGDVFEGRVKKKTKSGIYVWLLPGLDGLLPQEEFSKYIRDVSQLKEGDPIRVRIKNIQPDIRLIILSHPTR